MTDIVDAHHHIWRQADLAWLSGPMQPRIFGPYEPIRRDYPIREYLDDLAGSGVTRSVYVQTNWPNDRLRMRRRVQETANEHGWPHALVAMLTSASMTCARSSTACASAGTWRAHITVPHENPLLPRRCGPIPVPIP